MATTTANLGLTLPVGAENWSLATLNGNMSLIDAFAGSAFTGRTAIASGSDFNSFTVTTGEKDKFYYGADITTMSNGPSDTFGVYPFTLDVCALGSYVLEKLVVYGNYPSIYYREQYWGSGSVTWSSWMKVDYVENSAANVASDYSQSNIFFSKKGNFVLVHINGLKSIPTGSFTICSIPSGFRPSNLLYFDTVVLVNGVGAVKIRISAVSGVLSGYNYGASGFTDANAKITAMFA